MILKNCCCYVMVAGFLFSTGSVYGQVKIGDNPTIINSNSVLELESTNKGLVLPRLPLVNTDSISPLSASLLTGTIVYNTNGSIVNGSGKGVYYWDGLKWQLVATTSGKTWNVKGNDSLKSSINFLGTIDSAGLSLRTAAKEAMHIDSLQRISIDTNKALTNLDVNGGIRSSNLAGGGAVSADNNGILYLNTTLSKGAQNFDYTIPASTIILGAVLNIASISLASGKLDLTINFPTALSSTTASVIVSPKQDLPDNVVIAYARILSTTQMKVRFINSGTLGQTISGQIHITVNQY